MDIKMAKLYGIFVLSYGFLVVYLLIDVGKANDTHTLHRPKRFLSFRNSSKFFLRLNFKANMVPWNQIFAQALGFRVNWEEPPDSFHPYHHINRRSLYTRLEILLDKNGLNGNHCIRRAICEINFMSESKGIYHRILKIIFRRKSSATSKWHDVASEDCHLSLSQCSLSVLDVIPFTDV